MPTREKRQHRRTPLRCPIVLRGAHNQVVARGSTIDLSDGGAFVEVSLSYLPDLPREVQAELSVPRSTPNTFLLEPFASPAGIVRHQPLKNAAVAGIAIAFQRPLRLHLEA